MITMKPTVLVADDDPRLLKLIQRNLEIANYRVVTVSDGPKALKRAEAEEPALIAGPSSTMVGDASSHRETLPRPGMDLRPGVIEIDLADGVRLRVDAFVTERALRRVLAVLKATQ